MTITLDPIGKHGPVTEQVTIVNDTTTDPVLHIAITADVTHGADTSGDQLQHVIFSNRCSSCHGASSARDKIGAELYAAVCAMCHASPGDLLSQGKVTRQAIADGALTHGMPAYAIRHDGPLTDSQIQSLVQMINTTR